MPNRVETTEPDGVDFAWVMQTTFVLTIVLGAPIVALASIPVSLPTWGARAGFAIRVGAIVWIVVACGAFLYERHSAARRTATDGVDAKATDDGDGSPTRGDRETRTEKSRDDRRPTCEDGDRADRVPPSAAQSASSESSSET